MKEKHVAVEEIKEEPEVVNLRKKKRRININKEDKVNNKEEKEPLQLKNLVVRMKEVF